jgi:hypothetical protein
MVESHAAPPRSVAQMAWRQDTDLRRITLLGWNLMIESVIYLS